MEKRIARQLAKMPTGVGQWLGLMAAMGTKIDARFATEDRSSPLIIESDPPLPLGNMKTACGHLSVHNSKRLLASRLAANDGSIFSWYLHDDFVVFSYSGDLQRLFPTKPPIDITIFVGSCPVSVEDFTIYLMRSGRQCWYLNCFQLKGPLDYNLSELRTAVASGSKLIHDLAEQSGLMLPSGLPALIGAFRSKATSIVPWFFEEQDID